MPRSCRELLVRSLSGFFKKSSTGSAQSPTAVPETFSRIAATVSMGSLGLRMGGGSMV